MNVWLEQIIPVPVWLHLYLTSAFIAGSALFYLLEQLVIYGSGHFSHPTVALYRAALAVIIIALFAGCVEIATNGPKPNPIDVLIVTGLAILALLIAITHRRHRHFQR